MIPLIKPKHLQAGDTVGIVAPAGAPFEEGQLEFAFHWLDKLGLKYKLGKHIYDRHGGLAGTDADRSRDLNEMWADKQVKAIFPARGGNGAVRLLPRLDFEMIRDNPKIIIGYSDITGLLIPIHQKTGLVTFHGPTANSFFDSDYTYRHFQRALFEPQPLGAIEDPALPSDGYAPKYPPPRMVITPGTAAGQLTGGCLTLVKNLMGSPFEIETEGKILFLEEVREEPCAVDRMLCQLLLARKLQKAAGILFGESIDCKPGESQRKVSKLSASLESVLRHRLAGLQIPVVYGLRFGHGACKLTLPLGVMARLEAHACHQVRLSIDEAATSE